MKDDIEFLQELRNNIDQYLFLGYAPAVGSPGHDSGIDRMNEALRDQKFKELRRKITGAKHKAINIMSRFDIKAVYTQYPPRAIGGPIIEQHLLDMATENNTWQRGRDVVFFYIEK